MTNTDFFAELIVKEMETRGINAKTIAARNSSGSYTGIVKVNPGAETQCSAVVNVEALMSEMMDGASLEAILNEAENILSMKPQQSYFALRPDELGNFEKVKKHLILSLVGIERNREYLSDKVYRIVAKDLALVPRILIGISADGNVASAAIGRSLLTDGYKVSAEELFKAATESSLHLMKAKLVNINEMFQGILGEAVFTPLTAVYENESPSVFGAAALFYPGKLDELYTKYGEFYVLPSSTQEVLILPKAKMEDVTETDLRELVEDVNSQVESFSGGVSPLTNNVYKYDGAVLEEI